MQSDARNISSGFDVRERHQLKRSDVYKLREKNTIMGS